jgi:hypothetical protein
MTDTFSRAQLERLLLADADAAASRLKARFDSIVGSDPRPILLGGAGHLGRRTLACLREVNIAPIAFVDNRASLFGTSIDGVEVLSPAEAVSRHGEDAVFVVTVHNPSSLTTQLRTLGARRVLHYALLFWKFTETMLPYGNLSSPQLFRGCADRIREAFDLLADDISREEFLAQLQWRLTLDSTGLPPPRPASETYFSPEIVRLTSAETFVDCGAYDGDTLRAVV